MALHFTDQPDQQSIKVHYYFMWNDQKMFN